MYSLDQRMPLVPAVLETSEQIAPGPGSEENDQVVEVVLEPGQGGASRLFEDGDTVRSDSRELGVEPRHDEAVDLAEPTVVHDVVRSAVLGGSVLGEVELHGVERVKSGFASFAQQVTVLVDARRAGRGHGFVVRVVEIGC